MKTIPIDEQMKQSGERAMREGHEKFVQLGIDQWRKENEGHAVPVIDTSAPFWQPRSSKASEDMPHPTAESADK